MSLLEEKMRAVTKAREFLFDLLRSNVTPKVPLAVRQRAGEVLKHFPYTGNDFMREARESKKRRKQ